MIKNVDLKNFEKRRLNEIFSNCYVHNFESPNEIHKAIEEMEIYPVNSIYKS